MSTPFAFPRTVRTDEELIDVLGIALFHEDPVPDGLADRLVVATLAHQFSAPVAAPLDDALVAVREEHRTSVVFDDGDFQVLIECTPLGLGRTQVSFTSTWPGASVRAQAGTTSYDDVCDEFGVATLTVASGTSLFAVFTTEGRSVVLPAVPVP